MVKNQLVFAPVLLVLLTGCYKQPQWFHDTASEQQFLRDGLDCEKMAIEMHPDTPPPQVARPSRSTRTVCQDTLGNTFECTTEDANPFSDYGASVAQSAENRNHRERIKYAREDVFKRCMYSKNYELRTPPD